MDSKDVARHLGDKLLTAKLPTFGEFKAAWTEAKAQQATAAEVARLKALVLELRFPNAGSETEWVAAVKRVAAEILRENK